MERIFKIGAVGLAIVFALAACSKGSQSTNTEASGASPAESTAASPAESMAAASPAESAAASPAAVAANGAEASAGGKVYTTNCASCHQANGEGVPGTFPPLAKNSTVAGDATKVIHIVKYGLSGAVTVDGKAYNGMMPAWGQQLSNGDIASVITYIRASWGNSAGAVTPSQVAGVSQ
jgi:mono/diheme cytochrome c family protein